ncbi:hypothetical protein ARMSODRAFT_439388 [Armillaria solidipes]|uniref:Uncharacterized protein n=1 Tax=Armillaria solidipes TaxID=1076256 RepID=A0A2H3BL31_9AGAR|nr:hypothetical protein ARMSODRAFT_439388 [Armillaria solidipes]
MMMAVTSSFRLPEAMPQPHIVVIIQYPTRVLVPASQDPYTRQLMVTDIEWQRLLSPSTTFALLLFDFAMSVDPISVLTSIPDLIERCIKGYDFLKDVKDAPKACLELMKELDDTRAMLAELQAHVSGVGDKGKAAPLSASLQNYKTALDKQNSSGRGRARRKSRSFAMI